MFLNKEKESRVKFSATLRRTSPALLNLQPCAPLQRPGLPVISTSSDVVFIGTPQLKNFFLCCLTAKFIVSHCTYFKLRSDFGFFCSVNHLGRVNASHNVMCSPSLARNGSRLLKDIKRNRDSVWIFCRGKEADVALFLQGTRIIKIVKICEANLRWLGWIFWGDTSHV